MASKKIEIDIVVNGKMQKATVSAKKLRKALDGAGDSTDKLGKSARTTDRNLKGAAQTSANGTKNFSKMAQGIGGSLVPAYATLAANVFAVTAAFNAFQKAAQIEQLEANLIRVGNVAGQNLGGVAQSLRDITGAAIDTETALRATAQGTAQGFSATQLQTLATLAKGASISLGRDLPDALDRLIRGTAKLEPEILDELGIIVRLDDATREYAASLGKTAAQLTTFERQQAFANAVSEQGLKKFGEVAKAVESNPFDKLAASFMDLKKDVFQGINDVFEPVAKFLSTNEFALSGAILAFGSTIINQLTPALSDMAEAGRERFGMLAEEADKAAKAIKTKYGKALEGLKTLDISPKGFKELEKSIRDGSASAKDFKKAVGSLEASERKRLRDIETLKSAGKGLRGAQKSAHDLYVAEKETELALIQEQIGATKALEAIEAAGESTGVIAGSAAAAQNAGVRARQSGIEADALAGMQTAGLFGGLALASAGAKDLFGAVDEAEGGMEKFKRTGTATAGSVRLLGSAFLRFIPMLGLAMVAFDLLKGAINLVFDSPFEESALEKAIADSIENMDKMQQAAVDTQAAMLAAGSATERAFIGLRAGSGFVGQVAGEFTSLAKTITEADSERVDKLKREMSGDLGFMEFSDVSRRDAQKELSRRRRANEVLPEGSYETQVKAIRQELRESALEEAMGGTQGATAEEFLKQLNAARDNLLQLAEKDIAIAPEALAMLDAEISRVGELGSEFIVAGEDIVKFGVALDGTQDGVRRFLGAFDDMGEAISANQTAFDKFVQKSATKFTPLVQTSERLTGVFKSISDNFPDGLTVIDDEGKQKTLSILEAIEQSEDKAAIALSERLQTTDAYKRVLKETGSEQEALKAAAEEYNQVIIEADEYQRGLNALIKENKLEVKQAARFSKASVVFFKEEVSAKKEGIQLQIQSIDNELDYLATQKQTEEVTARITQLEKDRGALGQELKDLQNDRIGLAQAEFNEKKRIADVENKILGIQRESQSIAMQNLATNQARETREKSQRFGFEFIDQGRLDINQQIRAEQEKLRFEMTTQKEIDEIKKTMISAEYALLAEKLRVEGEIAKKKGQGMLNDDDPTNDARGQELVTSGTRLEELATKVETAEEKAVANVDRATEARIAGISETIAGLREAKKELEPLQVLLNGFEETMTTGMQNAIEGLLNGTATAKDAIKGLVSSMIGVINQLIAQLIVARILSAAIFGGAVSSETAATTSTFGQSQVNFDATASLGSSIPPPGRYGGVFSGGRKVAGYSMGGVASGPQAGYPAVLHGTEAVVPLPNNRSIPVDLKGSGMQQNTVTVNVSIDGEGNAQQDGQATTNQGAELGKLIASAVQEQLLEQKRSGGILNPYGVS